MEKVQKQIIFLVAGCWLMVASSAQAATLYFSPSSGEYDTGRTVSVSVYVSSADQAMNAASGIISFPQDKLEVSSLSKSGSILTLWAQEPLFSNSVGTINFEGIVLNPGFRGATGKIITINFRTKTAGSALVNFSSGAVLANDGKGTNILTSLGKALFSLGGAAPPANQEETPPASAGTPSAPEILSSTHPDSNKWYTAATAKFTWSLTSGVDSVRLLIGKLPEAPPQILYTPPIDEKEIPNLTDGVWYFHVQLRNAKGWGGTTHFRVQIDTEKPERFDITEIVRKDPTDPKATFRFDAYDLTSGIDYYEIQIDDKKFEQYRDDGSGTYVTESIGPGIHTMIVKAFDYAGNSSVSSAEFEVEPIAPPTITDYPRTLRSGEILTVAGTALSHLGVRLFVGREKEEPASYLSKANGSGVFTFTAENKLADGIYKLWAETFDERGARSNPTEKVSIIVEASSLSKLGSWTVSILTVVIPLVALLLVLIWIIIYGWHKISLLRKTIKGNIRKTEQILHNAFDTLKENLREQIKTLEKTKNRRELTKEEERVIHELKKNLEEAELTVKKEMEGIEQEL